MSDVRALVNYIGNGVATLAISRYQGEVSAEDLRQALLHPPEPQTLEDALTTSSR
jgi:aerobic C4-dicarboxylate transport protein